MIIIFCSAVDVRVINIDQDSIVLDKCNKNQARAKRLPILTPWGSFENHLLVEICSSFPGQVLNNVNIQAIKTKYGLERHQD